MALEEILSQVLRAVRLSGSVHFCLSPSGSWESSAGPTMEKFGLSPGIAVPFHIIAEGNCWLKIESQKILLNEGDIVAFPFATPHILGNGDDGPNLDPLSELPPLPWSSVPTLNYDGGVGSVRVLCGFLFCSALSFKPLSDSYPKVIHAKNQDDSTGWMRATTEMIEREISLGADQNPMLERLTETMFVQMLRQQINASPQATKGWLAAISDPAIGQCLAAIHQEPYRDWNIEELAKFCAVSHSALSERFLKQMEISPMRYVREWRLHLASRALIESPKTIATIGYESGYGSEAAFNRAFSKTYGTPPAAWRSANTKQS